MISNNPNSGVEVIRARVYVHAKHGPLGYLARDAKIDTAALEHFIGGGKLSNEVLDRIARHLMDAEYLPPPVDKLRSLTKKVAEPLCAPSYREISKPYQLTAEQQAYIERVKAGPVPKPRSKDAPPASAWPKAPGFIE